jgi:hypothetical protein
MFEPDAGAAVPAAVAAAADGGGGSAVFVHASGIVPSMAWATMG